MVTNDDIEVIKKIRDFYKEDPRRWHQGSFYRVIPNGDEPVVGNNRFYGCCLLGALDVFSINLHAENELRKYLNTKYGDYRISRFNDTHTFDEVMILLDSFISEYEPVCRP